MCFVYIRVGSTSDGHILRIILFYDIHSTSTSSNYVQYLSCKAHPKCHYMWSAFSQVSYNRLVLCLGHVRPK